MTETINDEELTPPDVAVEIDEGIQSFSITRALVGYSFLLTSIVGAVVLDDMTGGDEGLIYGLLMAFVGFSLIPLVFWMLGRRKISRALMYCHFIWVTIAVILLSVIIIDFNDDSTSINMTIKERLYSNYDNISFKFENLSNYILDNKEIIQENPELSFVLREIDAIIFENERNQRFILDQIFADRPSRDLNRVGDVAIIALSVLFVLKAIQAVAAWIPWTQRKLTPKRYRPKLLGSDPLAKLSEERRWLVRELTSRAAQMRSRAVVILLSIISLILGGIVSIYLAGDLVSSDAQQTTRITQITNIIDGFKKEVDDAESALTENESAMAERVSELRRIRRRLRELGGDTPDIDGALEKAGAKLIPFSRNGDEASSISFDVKSETDRASEDYLSEVAVRPPQGDPERGADDGERKRAEHTEVGGSEKRALLSAAERERTAALKSFAELLRRQELLLDEVAAAQEARKSLEKKLTENIDGYLVDTKPKETDIALLVASGLTRFGILIVVIFLVQILVGIYRYSLRLAAFYAARADALTSGLDRKSGLGEWGNDFLPEMIDFGRSPVTPAQYVVDVVRAYFDRKESKRNTGTGGTGTDPAGG